MVLNSPAFYGESNKLCHVLLLKSYPAFVNEYREIVQSGNGIENELSQQVAMATLELVRESSSRFAARRFGTPPFEPLLLTGRDIEAQIMPPGTVGQKPNTKRLVSRASRDIFSELYYFWRNSAITQSNE